MARGFCTESFQFRPITTRFAEIGCARRDAAVAKVSAESERNDKRFQFVFKNPLRFLPFSIRLGAIKTLRDAYVAKRLGLRPEQISTQVIPRDRHAAYFAALGIIASSVERLALEIRHLQHTEVREAEEYFAKGQKGSSAMPHKRNPVLTENLTGLARIVRAAVTPAMENVGLWHERDISHSSVERVFAPDATIALDFALTRLAGVIQNLLVYPKTMKANLDSLGGLVYSQRVLLALIQAGISREDAYRIVQSNAMQVWHEGGSFEEHLWVDKAVSKCMSRAELSACFDPAPYLTHVDAVFDRVFGPSGKTKMPRRK